MSSMPLTMDGFVQRRRRTFIFAYRNDTAYGQQMHDCKPINVMIARPARTMLTSEATTNRSTHVIEDLDTGRLRLLTPNETNKIQGFPEHWTDTGMSDRMQYFCMGNALVVGCITQMLEVLGKIVDHE